MANPKITLGLDQSVMDLISKATDALIRFCDVMENRDAPVRAYPENAEPDLKAINIGAGTVDVISAAETAAPDPAAPVATAVPDPAPFQFQMPSAAAPTAPAQPAAPQMPTMPFTAPAAPAAPQMPTTQPTFTMEQLGRAGLELSQRGVNAAAVLTEFQIMSLDQLPVEQYPAFAARLRQLGANI